MALRNLIVCINSADGKIDLPCVVLHSPSRDLALNAARCVLGALRPSGPSRTERHLMPAVDPGRHATSFKYERATASLLIDLSQSEVARSSVIGWVAPIAPNRHVQGVRRSIVIHCADLMSWGDQNALKKIIETSHGNTMFILTTSQLAALQAAIISRGVVIRCPLNNDGHTPRTAVTDHDMIESVLRRALPDTDPARTASAASKAAREAAYALSKLSYTSPLFLRQILEILLTRASNDADAFLMVEQMTQVDTLVATSRCSNRSSTIIIAMHKALLNMCQPANMKSVPAKTVGCMSDMGNPEPVAPDTNECE